MQLVLKVTKGCNLRCDYCYMALTDGIGVMSLDVVEAVCQRFACVSPLLTFSWHGGEPLLVGRNFYRKAVQVQKRVFSSLKDHGYRNSLQTNGLLFDLDWLDMLVSAGFSIGFSYDGPGHLNGARHDAGGKSLSGELTATLSTLKRERGFSPHVICVLSSNNASFPSEIYQHFKELSIESFSVLPYMGKQRALHPSVEDFFSFHRTLFDLWISDDCPFTKISPLDGIVRSVLGGKATLCSWSGRCFSDILSVDPNGDVYLCSALRGKQWRLGNVLFMGADELMANKNRLEAIRLQEQALANCSSCQVFDTCRSGCREAAYLTSGDAGGKDPNCEGRIRVVRYVAEKTLECLRAGSHFPAIQPKHKQRKGHDNEEYSRSISRT